MGRPKALVSPTRADHDRWAATVLIVFGLLAVVGGVTAMVTEHVHGGRLAGLAETIYGAAMLGVAWHVIWRLSWLSFLIGAPLLLLSNVMDGLLYDRADLHKWPSILAVLTLIEWGRRLIWPSRPDRVVVDEARQ